MAAAVEGAEKDARDAAHETLSQLAARVLNQLSLSAWLPSAALVLLVAFILQLGAQLKPGLSPGEVLTNALAAIGHTTLGGVVVLALIIVVTTMVTQAFSFEAIRVLEGYWGPGPRIEALAGSWSKRHSDRRSALEKRYEELLEVAWTQVTESVRDENLKFTVAMFSKLKERITGARATRTLTDDQRDRVRDLDWEARVRSNTLRQIRILELRLADYPRDASRVMPTRLGNVLRRYEVETGADDIEGFVERVYRMMPFSMQLSHDEQRARLDLYCSMVFVLWCSAFVGMARFGWWAWPYTAAIVASAVAGSFVAYRAAVSSARYYGALLVGIAEWLKDSQEG
jgi:hypothetical protein